MSQTSIQSKLDTIATQQVPEPVRNSALLDLLRARHLRLGTSDPLDFQVGFYTQVAGLGAEPGDVVINGAINVFNQCVNGDCEGTDNFWRSLSNLTLNVAPAELAARLCPATRAMPTACLRQPADLLALSQADPIRRVIVNGNARSSRTTAAPAMSAAASSPTTSSTAASSATTASSSTWPATATSTAGPTTSGTRCSWATTVRRRRASGREPASTRRCPTTPVSEEEPFLYTGSAAGDTQVFVPAVQRNSSRAVVRRRARRPGSSLPTRRFFIANPSTSVAKINTALAQRQGPDPHPGRLRPARAIEVNRPNTIVLGLGFADPDPAERATWRCRRPGVPGIKLSGMIFDAGPQNSPVLLQLGDPTRAASSGPTPNDPTLRPGRLLPDRRRRARQGDRPPDRQRPPDRSSTTSGRGVPTTAPVSAGPTTPRPTPA